MQKLPSYLVTGVCYRVAKLLSLLLFMLPIVVQASFNYTTNNGTVTLTTGNCYAGALTIPSTILVNGVNLPVTTIGDEAFYFCSSLTSIAIGNNVQNIGQWAFETCISLTNVTIGNSVTSIGQQAFYSCAYLNSVMIGNGVTNIATEAFSGCGLKNGITVDSSNSFYSSQSGVLFDKNQTTLIQCPELFAGSYTISNSIISIGINAFSGCSTLTNIMIPNSVSSIGDNAFSHCYNLISITIGTNVTSIGEGEFEGCFSLKSITIPNSVTSIGINAFYGCSSLTKILMSDSVTNIGSETFFGCLSLTNIIIPNSITSIETDGFADCSNLTSITIPSSVTSIGSWAFVNCPKLKQVIFLGNQPNADATVFAGDNNVTVYYLPGTTGWGAVFGNFTNASTVVSNVLWNPQAMTSGASFGVRTNRFGFNITGSSNLVIVVESCTNLANPVWSPLSTNTLNTFVGTNGTSYFSDPHWTNYPGRYYRLRSP